MKNITKKVNETVQSAKNFNSTKTTPTRKTQPLAFQRIVDLKTVILRKRPQ